MAVGESLLGQSPGVRKSLVTLTVRGFFNYIYGTGSTSDQGALFC